MSMKYIRDHYGVPAKRGARARYMNSFLIVKTGTIVGSQGSLLKIRMDGETTSRRYHPTYRIEYLDSEGNVIPAMESPLPIIDMNFDPSERLK